MNTNIQILGLLVNVINYIFVFLLIFNLLKVNYFNPIVAALVRIYKPISKIFFIFPNQIINILILAIIFKLLSLIIYFGSQYETITLLGVAIIQTLMTIKLCFQHSVIPLFLVSMKSCLKVREI